MASTGKGAGMEGREGCGCWKSRIERREGDCPSQSHASLLASDWFIEAMKCLSFLYPSKGFGLEIVCRVDGD